MSSDKESGSVIVPQSPGTGRKTSGELLSTFGLKLSNVTKPPSSQTEFDDFFAKISRLAPQATKAAEMAAARGETPTIEEDPIFEAEYANRAKHLKILEENCKESATAYKIRAGKQ